MYNVSHTSAAGRYDAIGLELVRDAKGSLVFFEFIATPVIARAIYAYLVGREHREQSAIVWNRDLPIRFSPTGRYTPIARRLRGHNMDSVTIAHQGLAAAAPVPELYFISPGGREPADWRPRLKQALPIGILDEWPSLLWQHLTHLPKGNPFANVLMPLDSQGDIEIWELANRDLRVWQRLLTDVIVTPSLLDAGAV